MPPGAAATVEVLAWFEPPVYATKDFAGSVHHVRIGERDAELVVALDGALTVGRPAPAQPRREPSFPEPPRARGNESAYKSFTMGLGVPEDVFAMDAVLLRFTDPALSRELKKPSGARELSTAIGDWMSIVRDWLAGWTNTLRAIPTGSATPAIEAVLVADSAAPPFRTGGRPSVVLAAIRKTTPEQVRAAFAAASMRLPIPLQHTLLADARVHFASDEYREAVIDACSAAEVALADAAGGTMSANGHGHKAIDETLRGVRGVVDLYRLVAASRQPLEVSAGMVIHRLANPRNLAAHRGELLDNESAMEAIKVSRALVKLTPLPSPEEIEDRARA